MLTSVDIHYLVGILCQASSQEDVDVILGDQVYNDASKTKRDIDITVTYKEKDGSIKAFIGYEVKDHSRPLDVSHIEQLCAKLKTHTQITKGNVVSASGYTKAAKEVAEFNKIDLFELRKWENTWEEFEHFKIIDGIAVTEFVYEWASAPSCAVFTSAPLAKEDEEHFSESCALLDVNGQSVPGWSTLKLFKRKLIDDSLLRFNFSPEFEQMPINATTNTSLRYKITNQPTLIVNERPYQITEVEFEGFIHKKEMQYVPEYKILVNLKDRKDRVGCIISQMRMGHLAGIAITEHNRGFQMILISLNERLKNKIFRQKIT